MKRAMTMAARAMVMATRVAGKHQASAKMGIATRAAKMSMVTMWAMATATRLADIKEGMGKGGKGKRDSNEGGGH